ncbi:hypothetical protein PC121_g9773 [Phytophthora cactorum]|nr:hypothetical protein PC120_g9425 [Phytophthora cactorum]KAG3069521.1 hypothetical protein PC121_g9773 [Phytophthora cactorum]KAG4061774.1 hypothetical protein PC123_g3343 [Phytophthora cactorum]
MFGTPYRIAGFLVRSTQALAPQVAAYSSEYLRDGHRSQTPVPGLSPFQTRNLDSSDSSTASAPIAMWEDEDITAMRIPLEKVTTTNLTSYGVMAKCI